jgi:hypothetical protein
VLTPCHLLLLRADAAPLREAARKALGPLQRNITTFNARAGCFSCHHHTLALVALTEASTSGLPVEADLLASLGRSGGLAQASCSGAVPGTTAVWASWTATSRATPRPLRRGCAWTGPGFIPLPPSPSRSADQGRLSRSRTWPPLASTV